MKQEATDEPPHLHFDGGLQWGSPIGPGGSARAIQSQAEPSAPWNFLCPKLSIPGVQNGDSRAHCPKQGEVRSIAYIHGASLLHLISGVLVCFIRPLRGGGH